LLSGAKTFLYDGSTLADEEVVVVVTIDYRLHILGILVGQMGRLIRILNWLISAWLLNGLETISLLLEVRGCMFVLQVLLTSSRRSQTHHPIR
jgi:hypothetical protein